MLEITRIIFVLLTIWSVTECQLVLEPGTSTLTKSAGDDVAVYCTNLDNAGDQPQWQDPSGFIIGTRSGGGSDHLHVVEDPVAKETKLQINDLEAEDRGQYGCSADSSSQAITISVFEGITFPNKADEQEQAFEIFQAARVLCTINSDPEPTIEWSFNENRIFDGQDGYTITLDGHLLIDNTTKSDEGVYECRGTIRSLSESASFDIAVSIQVPPEWEFRPGTLIEAVGGFADFHCKASGDPLPTYAWEYQGVAIDSTTAKYILRDNGEYLTINDLERADDGSYQCTASNAVESISATGDLKVYDPPQPNAQINVTKNEGQSGTLECTAVKGSEDAKLKWLKDEKEFVLGVQPTNSRISVAETGGGATLTMTFTNIQRADEGGYTCLIENEVGEANVTHFLFVEYEPTINTELTVRTAVTWENNPVNLTCHWYGYPIPKITWKRNMYRLINNYNVTIFDFNNGSSSCQVVPKLDDFGSYVCEANNKAAENSNSFTIDLIQAHVPEQPTNVRTGEVTSTTIEVQFDDPKYTGELPLTGYEVEYWEYSSTGGSESMSLVFNETEEIKIIGLSAQKQYHFRVAAGNDVGYGKWSLNATTTTRDYSAPMPPRITSATISEKSTQYELEWMPPEDNGGRVITKYTVYYEVVDSADIIELPNRHKEQPLTAETKSFILTDLKADSHYVIHLTAESALGEGEPAKINIKTAPGSASDCCDPTPVPSSDPRIFIAVIIAAFLVVLFVVDVACYCLNDCGVLMCICVQCCGKHTGEHSVDVELAEDYSKDDLQLENGGGAPDHGSEPIESDKLM